LQFDSSQTATEKEHELHIPSLHSNTRIQLASMRTVCQLHEILTISSTTLQLASMKTVCQLHVIFTNSSTTLHLASMRTVCQFHVMLANSSTNTAASMTTVCQRPVMPMWRSVHLCWFKVCIVSMIVYLILLLTSVLSCLLSLTFTPAEVF